MQASERQLRDQLDIAHERIFVLEKELGIHEICPAIFRLTPTETAIMGMMLQREVVRESALMAGLYGDRDANDVPGVKILHVFKFKLRQKLSPFGISIHTNWGRGWSMLPADKAKIRALMETEARV